MNLVFDCFTKEQVKEINKIIKKQITEKEKLSKSAQNVSKIGDFFHIPCLSWIELIHPWLYQCQIINKEFFGYDTYWDFHVENYSYNVYGKTGEYGWHIDANPENLYDMKLTCLLNLSEEPYEGGDFHLAVNKEKLEFGSGDGLIFTSLIAHKITPIIKGERISLTYWGDGPAWK